MEIPLEKINLDIRGVIHVGAHWGQEYDDYLKRGIKRMIFFEPVKSTYNKLLEIVPRDVITYNIALGNETGTREMFIETANNGQSSSLLEPGIHLQQYPHIKFESKETVRIDKLDNIKFNRKLYNFINIDTQGFELEVLKGAKKTLKYIDCIYMEVNQAEVYKRCPMVEEIDCFLKDFRRIETTWIGITWGDAIYIKHK